ncbi:hypothetical protein EYF80_056428 [Liparis tanakae]|uniref:Uncharacterized protein n=1 Tax=Liparis tanakae TaxID=230148 RepID=A0A4Z2EX62_9TELE|nr:hypothetical protein EYF80_056428 [Liparis tanakae]
MDKRNRITVRTGPGAAWKPALPFSCILRKEQQEKAVICQTGGGASWVGGGAESYVGRGEKGIRPKSERAEK